MDLQWIARALVVSVLSTLGANPTLAGVIDVNGTGPGDFTSIQAAVNAAVDGDIILIRPGTYAGFDIVGKSLTVISDGKSPVGAYGINKRVAVKNLSAGKTVVLSRLTMWGTNVNVLFDDGGSALFVENCVGAVRIQATQLAGADGTSSHPSGYPAVLAIDSTNVELTGCTAAGGDGLGQSGCAGDYSFQGHPGGQALRQSGSDVVVHTTSLIGGDGGDACLVGGSGGASVLNVSGSVLLCGCTVTGGDGGFADEFLVPPAALHPGDGGPAVFVTAGQTVSAIESALTGGEGGHTIYGAGGPHGANGPVTFGAGTLNLLPFPARSLTITPIARELATTSILIKAPVGETALMFLSASAGPLIAGPEVVPFALGAVIGPFSLGVIPASGSSAIPVANPLLPPGIEGVRLHLQVVTSGPSGFALTGSTHFVLLSSLL